MTNTELSTSLRPLPRSLVEQVSAAMLYTYGKRFTDLWGPTKPDVWLAHWANSLAGYTVEEIKRGLAGLESREWPPTLPEFKRLCRPPVDPQAAFYEAVEGVQARERGERGTWSHPAIYWAAVKVGAFDLKNCGYQQIAKRWEAALQGVFDSGECMPIPDPALALPAPGKSVLSREKAVQLMAELGASGILRKRGNPRSWIDRIRDRQRAGDDTLPAAAVRLADAAEHAETTGGNDE